MRRTGHSLCEKIDGPDRFLKTNTPTQKSSHLPHKEEFASERIKDRKGQKDNWEVILPFFAFFVFKNFLLSSRRIRPRKPRRLWKKAKIDWLPLWFLPGWVPLCGRKAAKRTAVNAAIRRNRTVPPKLPKSLSLRNLGRPMHNGKPLNREWILKHP